MARCRVRQVLIFLALLSVVALTSAACGAATDSPRVDEAAAAAQTSAYVYLDDVPGIDGMTFSRALQDHIKPQVTAACGGTLCFVIKPVPDRPDCAVDKHDKRYPLPARYLRGATLQFPVTCPAPTPTPGPAPPCQSTSMGSNTGMGTCDTGMTTGTGSTTSTESDGTHEESATDGSTPEGSTGSQSSTGGAVQQPAPH